MGGKKGLSHSIILLLRLQQQVISHQAHTPRKEVSHKASALLLLLLIIKLRSLECG